MPQMLVDGKTTQIDDYGNCPECGSSWDAGAVFDVWRKMDYYAGKSDDELRAMVAEAYGGNIHARFSKLIGVTIRHLYDGVWAWKCPDCGKEWERFGHKQRR